MTKTDNRIGFITVTFDVSDVVDSVVHVSVQLTNNEDIAVSVGNECYFAILILSLISFLEQRLKVKS